MFVLVVWWFALLTFRRRAKWFAYDTVKYLLMVRPDVLALDEASTDVRSRAIVFDLGGVLVSDVRENLFPRLAREHDDQSAEILASSDELWNWASREPVSEQEFWKRFSSLTGVNRRLEYFHAETLAVLEENGEVRSLLEELKGLGFRLGLLTNNTRFWLEAADNKFGILALFDEVWSSASEEVTKPSPASYLRLVDKLGGDPAVSIFVDDREPNCQGAERAGLIAIRFSAAGDLRKELRRYVTGLRTR